MIKVKNSWLKKYLNYIVHIAAKCCEQAWEPVISSKSAKQSRLCGLFFAHCLVSRYGRLGRAASRWPHSWSGILTPVWSATITVRSDFGRFKTYPRENDYEHFFKKCAFCTHTPTPRIYRSSSPTWSSSARFNKSNRPTKISCSTHLQIIRTPCRCCITAVVYPWICLPCWR